MSHVMQNDGGAAGIFVQEGTIVNARSISNEDIFKNGKPVDVGVELTLEIGKEYQPVFSVSGNFKIDANGKVSDSSATKVKILLQNLKVKWTKLNPDNSIPDDVLSQLVGKSIVYLRYPYKMNEETQKPKYRTFDYILPANAENAKARVRAKFNEAAEKGYVKPLSEDTSFPPPAAVEVPAETAQF